MKTGRIESFDPKKKSGVIRLDEDGGDVPVHFSTSVCRGVVPEVGMKVRAGDLDAEPGSGGPFSDTFAMRAGLVEPDTGHDLETVQTVGLTAPQRGTNWEGDEVLRVPFDPSTFPELRNAFPEQLLRGLSFTAASPVKKRDVPKHLELISGLCDVARRAYRYRVTKRKPAPGSSFIGGGFADLGNVPWPRGSEGPLRFLAQLGVAETKKLGLQEQLVVFLDPAAEYLASTLHVIRCAPGARVVGPGVQSGAEPLELIDEVAVFPSLMDIQAAYGAIDELLPLDVHRFWDVEVLEDDEFHTVQQSIIETFPDASDLDADVVLGGFTHVGGSYKRVLTLAADHFDWLHELFENSPKAAIDLNTDEREWHAVLHGVG